MLKIIIIIQIILTAVIPTFMAAYGIYRKNHIPEVGERGAWIASKRAKRSQEALSYQYTFLAHMILVTGLNILSVSEIFLTASIFILKGHSWITVIATVTMQGFSVLLDIVLSRRMVERYYDENGKPLKKDKDEYEDENSTTR